MTSMTETNMAQDYADSLAETLAEVVAAIEADEEYEGQDAREYLDEMPLELIAEVTWSGRSGAQYARLETAWGTDKGYRSSDAIRYVADYFSSIMGEE